MKPLPDDECVRFWERQCPEGLRSLPWATKLAVARRLEREHLRNLDGTPAHGCVYCRKDAGMDSKGRCRECGATREHGA